MLHGVCVPVLPQNLPPGQSWGPDDTLQSQMWSDAAPRWQSERPEKEWEREKTLYINVTLKSNTATLLSVLHQAIPDQLKQGSSGGFNPRCHVDSWALSGVPELQDPAAAHPGCPRIIWNDFWIPWAFWGGLIPSIPEEESLRKRGETQILRITFPALPLSDATAICLPGSSFLSFSIQFTAFTPLTYNMSVGACESDTGDPGPMHAFVAHSSHPQGCKHLWFIHFTVLSSCVTL